MERLLGALLNNLSKAFDCLPHSLLIAKLKAYGFDNNSLNLVNDYLSHHFERTKMGNEYKSWKEIISRVPQVSILGPRTFNIHLCDLFFIIEKFDIGNFADENGPYVTAGNISSVVKLLEEVAATIFQWFQDIEIKANADKCYVLLNKSNELTVKINEFQIKNSQSEKLQGITIDNDFKFEDHINNICRKASAKISALSRIAPYMDLRKRKQWMNTFIYSPWTWMMHSRKLNSKINRLHERCLRVTYNDGLCSFEELLERDSSVSVHNRNIQCLAVELYKVFIDICPDIMKDVFPLSTSSN